MRKRVALIVMLFVMVSVIIINSGQSVKYIAGKGAGKDGEIEWQSYGEEELG